MAQERMDGGFQESTSQTNHIQEPTPIFTDEVSLQSTSSKENLQSNKETVLNTLEDIRKDFPHIPINIFEDSESKILIAFAEFEASPEKLLGQANSAFLIHSRRYEDCDPELDDAGRCFPVLSQKYGVPDALVDKIWNLLPPFRVGKIAGTMPNGAEIDCALISVPLTTTRLYNAKSFTERTKYGIEKASEAVDLARKLGAQTIGLGETLASLTIHGKELRKAYPKEQFPELEFVTGHTFTTYYIRRWAEEAASMKGLELKDATVTILGANGSIGTAMMELLAEKGVKKLILHDQEGKEKAIEKKAGAFPQLDGKTEITHGGNKNLKAACENADIIVSGVAEKRPIIKVEDIKPGTIFIDDSQPPIFLREVAEQAGVTLLWVVGKLPLGIDRTFDYGIDGEWGCAMEVVAKQALGPSSFEGIGPVNAERVRKAEEIATTLGYELPFPQSFGKQSYYPVRENNVPSNLIPPINLIPSLSPLDLNRKAS